MPNNKLSENYGIKKEFFVTSLEYIENTPSIEYN